MFEMTVNDILKINKSYTVSGNCNGNENLRPGTVKDDQGREYRFFVPLSKQLVFDNNKIMLQLLEDDIDLSALKGQKLYQH